MTTTRTCENDGTEFEAARDHARFCSDRCRVAWNRSHAGETSKVTGNGVTRNGFDGPSDEDFVEAVCRMADPAMESARHRALFDLLWDMPGKPPAAQAYLEEVVAEIKATHSNEHDIQYNALGLFLHGALGRHVWRIWDIAYQAGADSDPGTEYTGRASLGIVTRISELAEKLYHRTPEAFITHVPAEDRDDVAAKLEVAADTLTDWASRVKVLT